MTREQKMYFLVRELREILDTPAKIFEERMWKWSEDLHNSGSGIKSSEIKRGIDYKKAAIELCVKQMEDLW